MALGWELSNHTSVKIKLFMCGFSICGFFLWHFVAELLRHISVRSEITITINQEKSVAIKYRYLSIMLKLNTVVENWGLGFGFWGFLLMDG